MKKFKSHLLEKRFHLSRLELDMLLIFVLSLGVTLGSFFTMSELIIPNLFAATSPWTQTDWSGGVASGVVTSTVTTYASETDIDTTTTGEFKLDLGSELLTNTGFETDASSWEAGIYPKTISGMKIWYKADAITGLNDGDTITTWEDSSDSDYDATQSTAGNRPIYKTGIINSKPVVRFDGNNDYMQKTSVSGFTNQASVFLMQKINGSQTSGSYELGYNSGVNTGISNIPWAGTMYSRVGGAGSGDITWSYSVPYTNLLTQIYNGSSLNHKAWENGTLKNTTSVSSAFSNSPNTITLGALSPSSYWLQTDIAEIIFYNAALSDANRKGVEAYIQNKWGLSSSYHSIARNTDTKYSGTASLKVIASTQDTDIWQLLTTGDTDTYSLEVYAYTDGSAVSGTDAVLLVNGSTVTTSYTHVGSNWYKLSASVQGAVTPRDFGVRVLNGKTVYLDNFSMKKYSSTATLLSNTLNAEFAADWGALTYTTSGTGTTTVKVRTDSNSNMSTATDWSSCSGISSGTDLTTTDCVTDTDQYLQYQVTLNPSGSSTPVFESISIAFTASDQVDPDVNASSLAITALGDTNAWTNTEPTITWTSGEDDGDNDSSGLAGYCIALDEVSVTGSETSTALNPETSAGSLLNALDDGITNNSTCPYIAGPGNITSINLSSISGLTLTTGKHYYFSIKAVDLAGNVYSGVSGNYQDLVDFKYDSTAPTNVSYISAPSTVFGNVDDMSFNWPTSGAGISSDSNSGVIGWQYSLDSGSNWRGPDTQSTLGVTYIEDDGSTSSHTLSDAIDGSDINEGINTIYFRTVDEAGNFSSGASYRTAPLNYGGEAPSFDMACDLTTGVTVTPSTSTSNSFALSWDAATATGGNSVAGYYYMINTSPPSTLSTLESNSTQYIQSATTSVSASKLTGSVKGTNTVYVVAYDDADNYSQSNCLKGTYTLNSTLPDPVTSLSASDASIKSDELWRASLTWNEPSYKGTGTLTYVVQRSTDNSSWSTITSTTGTSYTDTVTTSQTYYYRVGVKDTTSESIAAPTYSTSVSVLPKGTWDSAPTLSSGPTVTEVTTKKTTISWSTGRVSDSKVSYGTGSGSYFDEEPSNSTQLTSHEINLTNLSPGTTYYYKTKWTDEDGNTGTSGEKTFTTDAAPVAKDISVRNIGLSTATIQFTVTGASSVSVYYGETTSFGGVANISTSTSESDYSVILDGLQDGTKYYYKINAFDSEEDEYEGSVLDFQTLPAPRISTVRIQQVKGAAQPTAYVTWNTNTEVSSIVTYYPIGNTSAARDEVNVALTSGEHSMIIRGLLPNTPYTLIIKGRDILGNEASSDPQTITTATDTRPPSISNIKVEGTVETLSANDNSIAQLVVSWDTDEPSTSQVEFGEGTGTTYSQKTQEDLNLTFNHIVVISGLTPSKVYHLRALSADEAGNIGNSIDTVTITPKATKSALDLVINNLSEVFGFLGGLR